MKGADDMTGSTFPALDSDAGGQRPLIPADLAETLLALALERGGDYADIYAQRQTNRTLLFEEGRVRSTTHEVVQGVGIRVQDGAATGYATSDDLDPTGLRRAARQAAAIAAGGGGSSRKALTTPTLPDRHPRRRTAAGTDLGERVALARAAFAHASADPRVTWASVHLGECDDLITIATSDGIFVTDRRPRLNFFIEVTGVAGERRESAYATTGVRAGLEWLDHGKPEALAVEALRRLAVKFAAAEAPVGSMPVVLAAGVGGGAMLHEAVGHGLEADFIRKGASAYSDRLGEQVANPLVTVFDRADLPTNYGALNVDDEGIIPHHTSLIEQGRLVGFLNDRLSARLMGMACSGNGRRQDYRHIPQPRMRITGLAPGPHHPDEIIASIGHGLYVVCAPSGSVDISKGDFNFDVEEAYLIEHGRLGRPVRGACLIGNGPEVLRRIAMIGTDLNLAEAFGHCGKGGQSVPVGEGTPTVLIRDLVVGGRGA